MDALLTCTFISWLLNSFYLPNTVQNGGKYTHTKVAVDVCRGRWSWEIFLPRGWEQATYLGKGFCLRGLGSKKKVWHSFPSCFYPICNRNLLNIFFIYEMSWYAEDIIPPFLSDPPFHLYLLFLKSNQASIVAIEIAPLSNYSIRKIITACLVL